MGCIFSEVATWVTGSYPKLLEYRRRRSLEVGEKEGTEEERFHARGQLLETAEQIHNEIFDNSRKNDHVTPLVVGKLVDGMVLIDPRARGTAWSLYDLSRRIYGEARKKMEGPPRRVSGAILNHTNAGTALEVRRPRLPPNLPPSHGSRIPMGSFNAENSESYSEQMHNFQYASAPSRQQTIDGSPPQRLVPQMSIRSTMRHDDMNREANYHAHVAAQVQEPYLSSPRPEQIPHYLSSPSTPSHQREKIFRNTEEMVTSSPQINRPRTIPGPNGHTRHSNLPRRPQENWVPPPEQPVYSQSRTQDVIEVIDYRDSDTSLQDLNVSPESQPTAHDSDVTAESPSHPKWASHQRPHPQMSVDQGLSVKRSKDKGRFAKYPGEDLVYSMDAILRYRDHVCLLLASPREALIIVGLSYR